MYEFNYHQNYNGKHFCNMIYVFSAFQYSISIVLIELWVITSV